MEAVIATGGKQYRVVPGQVLTVEKLAEDAGSSVQFTSVLMVTRDGGDVVTRPDALQTAKVSAEVVRHGRARKVSVVKFKRRKNYRRRRGHRQPGTTIRITNIEV